MFSRRALAAALGIALVHPTQAGTILTNGDFSQYTTTVSGQGFQPDYNGTLTGWSNGGSSNYHYNFLFIQPSGNKSSNQVGATGQYGTLNLWDASNKNTGDVNTWNGNGPSNGKGGYYNFVAMDGDFNTGALTQTLTGLTAGDHYAVTFSYAFSQQQGFDGVTHQNMIVGLGSTTQYVLGQNYTLASHGFSGWAQATLVFTAASATQALSFLAYGAEPVPPFALLANISIVDTPEPAAIGVIGTGIAALLAARRRRARLATGA